MEIITFSGVLPQVFSSNPPGQSAVWQQEVSFERGKSYLVEADSGCGKSTLCSYITGSRNDYSGTILFDQTDVSRFSRSQWLDLRRRVVSSVYQDLRLFPELTAIENIEIKNRLTHHIDGKTISAWLAELDIAEKRDTPVRLLSFGQQQRVAIIRSLCQPFSFLLADEPVSHLDDDCAQAAARLIAREASRQGAAVIATSIGRHLPLSYNKVIKL